MLCVSLGHLSSSSSRVDSRSRRLHRTIPFESTHQTSGGQHKKDDDHQDEDDDDGDTDRVVRRKRHSASESLSSDPLGSSADSASTGAIDPDDLQLTLAHMKEEHASHLKQFEAAKRTGLSPSPTSPPLPLDAHRRIFIVAHRLPLHVSDVTGLATAAPTPIGSPIPTQTQTQPVDGADTLSEFSLGESASSAPQPVGPNSFDTQRRPSFSSLPGVNVAGGTRLPGSSTNVVDGKKFQVVWDDSRSFLSNLRCLLSPHSVPIAGSGGSPDSASSIPHGLSEVDQPEVTWVGLSDITSVGGFGSEAERAAYESILKENHCLPIYLEPEVQSGFQAFCGSILWPLLHYMMPTNTNQNVAIRWAEYWQIYLKANQAYADAICAQMRETHSTRQEEPIIWCHNHQLFSLPQMIRQQLPRATIGLFIHTPFPSSDVFRSLPSRKEILESMMEADLLGFHTYDYARHFLSCIKRVLDLDFETHLGGLCVKYNGRFVSILISHVGIHSRIFKEAAESDILKRRVDALRAKYHGKKILLGIDDVDAVKAPMLKLQAYDRFLSRHPEWIGKTVILQRFLPSRNMATELGQRVQRDLDAYILTLKQKYGSDILHVIHGDMKTSHGVDGKPVTTESKLKLMELVGLYNVADVTLVSTFFEGLNVIPYEATASQGSSVPCALIISEFMGCSRSLNGVLRVNPWSLEAISDAIHAALSMTNDERRANHSRRYNYVMHHTIDRWANGFLDQLNRATRLGAELNYVQVGGPNPLASASGPTKKSTLLGLKSDFVQLPTPLLVETYAAAGMRVILLDYDGTLVPADKVPNCVDASGGVSSGPPGVVLHLLRLLSADPSSCVFIMSGRTRAVLSDWFGGIPNLGLAAEKGLFLKFPERIAMQCRFDINREQEEIQANIEAQRRTAINSNDSASDTESDTDSDSDSDSSTSSPRSSSHVRPSDWECILPDMMEDKSWKSTAMEIIKAYTEQTDGAWIEPKEFAIVWHYEVTHTLNTTTHPNSILLDTIPLDRLSPPFLLVTSFSFCVSSACRCRVWSHAGIGASKGVG